MLVFFNFFNNFNFIFLILSSIRIFILYFFLLDDSNRYLSCFQDGKNHWHEEDIAVDNVERLQSEKEKEKGEKGWKVDTVDRSFPENISMKDRCRGWIFVREIIPRITMVESWKNDEKKEADCSLLLLSDSTWKEPMFLDYTFIFIFLVLSIPSTA